MGFIHRIISLAFCSTILLRPVHQSAAFLPTSLLQSEKHSSRMTARLPWVSSPRPTRPETTTTLVYGTTASDRTTSCGLPFANRATPITDPSSATFALTTGRSNLVLSNTDGQLLWMARNLSASEISTGEATLDDTGNFILRTSEGVVLWQSFDYPTDTLLPGMNLRITHNRHALQRLVSWKDPQDPSPGSFSYGEDPDALCME
ncbi:hypothetical protein HU200_022486 [Digitaria exilis]|uniref:non-specific serine/threonine protein kinase n=1 Tax=Digitaria exilis TaxID=1010633 RepID=A0A835CCY3_9POAL|nr:hypothetical protein HU200_022486 [Digitaria exilis]